MSEYKLHIAVIKHLRSAFPSLFFFHIPNQSRNATEAFFNKQMGARPGAADLLVAWQGGVGVIELKTDKGRISNDQNRFLSSADALGWKTAVCRSVKEVHNHLCFWGLKPVHHVVSEPDYSTQQEKFKQAFDYFKPSKEDKP